MKNKKLILVALNEINFDKIKIYIKELKLKNLEKLFKFHNVETDSENDYEYLEPWIQWTSIHTGLKAKDHKIFHLGDIHNLKTNQIFEEIENLGYRVGAISPMNTVNKLNNPSYFIPDPWTDTDCDKSLLSRYISETISDTVKKNSSLSLNFKTIIKLIFIFISVVRLKKYFIFVRVFLNSITKKWYRAIFLDLLINEIHLRYYKRYKPNFSSVFFNAGAHIQHHYFLSSKFLKNENKNPDWYISKNNDPLRDVIKHYDSIVGDYINSNKFNFILATGLRQVPVNKPIYYWKLKDYENFLKFFIIDFDEIQQLMSRDFIIHFNKNNIDNIDKSFEKLKHMMIINKYNKSHRAFEILEKREDSIFVSLTFSEQISNEDYFFIKGQKKNINCLDSVNFVAIKNGIHDSIGYVFTNISNAKLLPKMHTRKIFDIIIEFFTNKNETNKL